MKKKIIMATILAIVCVIALTNTIRVIHLGTSNSADSVHNLGVILLFFLYDIIFSCTAGVTLYLIIYGIILPWKKEKQDSSGPTTEKEIPTIQDFSHRIRKIRKMLSFKKNRYTLWTARILSAPFLTLAFFIANQGGARPTETTIALMDFPLRVLWNRRIARAT